MQREIRTASFAGKEYKFVVYDVEGIKTVPGVDRLVGFADHPEGAAHSTWWTFQDEAEVRERHWHFKPGEVVFDLGPAFGSYSITAAIQGARVFAFEPCLFCRSMLVQNIEANNLQDRIAVLPFGVHERAGVFNANTAELLPEGTPTNGTDLLKVTSLDESMTLLHVDCMKLDVEGAELGALKGAEELLRRNRPRILIEEHEFKTAGIGMACEGFLLGLDCGYRLIKRQNHGSVNHGYYRCDNG